MRKNKELDGRVMLPRTDRMRGGSAQMRGGSARMRGECVTRLGFPSSSSHRERIASFAAVHYPDERQLTLLPVSP